MRAIRAAKAAAPDLFLNARTDLFLDRIGEPAARLESTLERLRAYLDAGADGIFVPGIADAETIGTVARASAAHRWNSAFGRRSSAPAIRLENPKNAAIAAMSQIS